MWDWLRIRRFEWAFAGIVAISVHGLAVLSLSLPQIPDFETDEREAEIELRTVSIERVETSAELAGSQAVGSAPTSPVEASTSARRATRSEPASSMITETQRALAAEDPATLSPPSRASRASQSASPRRFETARGPAQPISSATIRSRAEATAAASLSATEGRSSETHRPTEVAGVPATSIASENPAHGRKVEPRTVSIEGVEARIGTFSSETVGSAPTAPVEVSTSAQRATRSETASPIVTENSRAVAAEDPASLSPTQRASRVSQSTSMQRFETARGSAQPTSSATIRSRAEAPAAASPSVAEGVSSETHRTTGVAVAPASFIGSENPAHRPEVELQTVLIEGVQARTETVSAAATERALTSPVEASRPARRAALPTTSEARRAMSAEDPSSFSTSSDASRVSQSMSTQRFEIAREPPQPFSGATTSSRAELTAAPAVPASEGGSPETRETVEVALTSASAIRDNSSSFAPEGLNAARVPVASASPPDRAAAGSIPSPSVAAMSRREPQGQPSVTTAALTGVADPNIRQAVREVLENVSCSDVQPVYAGESVQLQGYVSSEAARDTITREVKALVGAGARYEALEVIEPPFCSHLELAEADGAHNGPIIRLNKEDGVYRDGDYLVVTMLAPPEQDGYLRVDFIDTDGTVVHMLPSRYNSNNAIDRGNVIQLGVADRRLTGDAYELTAPFGRAMIVAHWSESPILSAPRPEVEPSAPYLAALSEAISTNATDYRREHVFIEIHPRQD